MGNLIFCEFAKLKRRKLLLAAALCAVVMPALFGFYFVATSDSLDEMSIQTMFDPCISMGGMVVLVPLLAVLASNLLFAENDNDTLKNLLTVPIAPGMLVLAKLLVLLLFSVVYMLVGFAFSFVFTLCIHGTVDGWLLQLGAAVFSAFLFWAAAMPCVLLVVWLNKSYIISVIATFAYTVANYLLSSSPFLMQPYGLNPGTLLPSCIITRWYYPLHGAPTEPGLYMDFYNKFSPYFVSAPQCFAVLALEAAVCLLLITRVYKRHAL